MKQEDLAKLVGVRRETIGHLEKGKYNRQTIFMTGSQAGIMRMPSVNPTTSSRNRFPSIFIFLSANVSAIIADAIPTPLPSLKS